MTYEERQEILLNSGWNLISFYVQVTLNQVTSVSNNITEIQSSTQKWKRNYITMFNTLTQIEINRGYWVYLDRNIGETETIILNGNVLINSRSIPASKINLGLPFWGLMWDAPDINEPFTGSSADIIYYNIPELIGNGWNYNWDSDALCPYLINDDNSQIIT